MKRVWWKLALGILLVFFAGTVFGVIGTILTAQNMKRKMEDPKVGQAMVVKHLDRKLELDDAQREKISQILGEMFDDIVPIRDEGRLKLAEVLSTHSLRIREVLNPAQEADFDQFLQRLANDWNVTLPKSGQASP